MKIDWPSVIDRGPDSWFARPLRLHCNPQNRQFYFLKMAPAELPATYVDRALKVHAFVAMDLGLSTPPQILFYGPVDWREAEAMIGEDQSMYAAEMSETYFRLPSNVDGYTPFSRKNQIWIRSDLGKPGLEVLIAHELRHVWQRGQGPTFADVMDAEADAYPYGYHTAKNFLAGRDQMTPEIESDLEGKIASMPAKCAAEPYIHALAEWRDLGVSRRRHFWSW